MALLFPPPLSKYKVMNRKMISLPGLILLLASALHAQQNAFFYTTIHFEDAMGNKDSVIVGYDPLATSGIDTEFGEVEITAPFDSILEVRAISRFDFEQRMSKVIIDESEFIPAFNCTLGPRIGIFVWAKYQPVTVTWDSTVFLAERCRRGSFLSNHILDEIAGPIHQNDIPDVCVCMAAEDTYAFDLTYEGLLAQYQLAGGLDILHALFIEAAVEGMGVQVIYGLRFNPEQIDGYTPCYWITVGTESPGGALPLVVFPNPASGQVKLAGTESAGFEGFQVFGINGHLMQTLEIKNAGVDLSGLPSGIYLLKAQDRDGKRYVSRVVKL